MARSSLCPRGKWVTSPLPLVPPQPFRLSPEERLQAPLIRPGPACPGLQDNGLQGAQHQAPQMHGQAWGLATWGVRQTC